MSDISGIILLEGVRYCKRYIVLEKDDKKQLIK